MKTTFLSIACSALIICLAGCGSPKPSNAQTPQISAETTQAAAEQQTSQAHDNAGANTAKPDVKVNKASNEAHKSIVVYYSRTDENYNVGKITVGNTAKVAAEIAKQTGADLFEIKPVKPYPANYQKCIEVAQQEKDDNARPQIATTVENFGQYRTVYLGYPNWWGDMPMIVYTFIESQNFDDKTVIPFVTHEGSGLSGTPQKLRKALPKATVTDGIAITGSTAQNKPDEVTKKVSELIKQAPKD